MNLRGPAQAAARDVRKMLDVTGTDQLDPNPRTLLQTRHAIDGLMEGEENPKVVALLTDTRRAIDDHLAQAVPGIKQVDAKFAELARQRDALTRGQELLRNGPNAVRPAELADELTSGVQPQGLSVGPSAVPLRLRQGARADIDRIVGTSANDRVALQRLVAGEGDWNPAKLGQLFGEDRANRILQVLDNERTFAGMSDFVTKNSATAAREEAVKRLAGDTGNSFGVRQAYEAGGMPGIVRATGTKAVSKVAAAIARRELGKAAMAKLLVNTNHGEVADTMARIAAPFLPPPTAIGHVARALLLAAPAPSRR